MKIIGPGAPTAAKLAETAAIEAPPPTASAAAAPTAAEPALQSAILQPALQALRAAADFDHDKVAALRDALAKGEVPFNAGRLAGLIERYHGGER